VSTIGIDEISLIWWYSMYRHAECCSTPLEKPVGVLPEWLVFVIYVRHGFSILPRCVWWDSSLVMFFCWINVTWAVCGHGIVLLKRRVFFHSDAWKCLWLKLCRLYLMTFNVASRNAWCLCPPWHDYTSNHHAFATKSNMPLNTSQRLFHLVWTCICKRFIGKLFVTPFVVQPQRQ